MRLEGGCYCAAVRYVAEGEPVLRAQCHCRACQYFGGAPNLFMLVPAEGSADTKGAPKTYRRVPGEFCGTHMISRRSGRVTASTLSGALGLGLRDRGGRAAGSQARDLDRHPLVRQGLGADHHPARRRQRALRLTTARYFTPSGRSIQAKGISPDIEVLQDVPEELKARTDTKGEASLRGHLKARRRADGSQSTSRRTRKMTRRCIPRSTSSAASRRTRPIRRTRRPCRTEAGRPLIGRGRASGPDAWPCGVESQLGKAGKEVLVVRPGWFRLGEPIRRMIAALCGPPRSQRQPEPS